MACAFWITIFFFPNTAVSGVPIEVMVYTQVGERAFSLETACTPGERERGLMDRDALEPHDGMIFVFPQAGDHKFWMRNTRIPLDMVFIDDQQTVVAIKAEVPAHTNTLRYAGQPVTAVIELDGGRAAREGIALGDKVRYVLPEGIVVE